MKTSSRQPLRTATGFTLIEMLVVIGIIGILAGLLLPVLSRQKTKTKIMQAKTEMANLAAAINQYYATYSRLPTSVATSTDTTFGLASDADFAVGTILNNSDIMIILGNLETGVSTSVNFNSAKNPQRINFLPNIKPAANTSSPGLASDNIYRDPWGQPYIITLDLNADDVCNDGGDVANIYGTVRAPVIIFSKGDNKLFDRLGTANPATNPDNVLSWR